MPCGIQSITIIPETGTVVNQRQSFRAKVKIRNSNSWVISECKLTVTNTKNCDMFLSGVTSFNLKNISANTTEIAEIPFTAYDSVVGEASVTISFNSVIDGTHYCSNLIGAGCWDMVNPNPLTCSNLKTEKLEIIAS